MIAARLAPAPPPGPDPVRTPHADGSAAPSMPGGERMAENPDRPDPAAATRPDPAGRAQRSERSQSAGRTDADGADRDADSFERMVDREGAQAADTQRATAADTAPAGPGEGALNTNDAAPRDALPAQLLALLSQLAPAGAPSSGVPAGASAPVSTSAQASTHARAAGAGAALPTLTLAAPVDPARLAIAGIAPAAPAAAASATEGADALAALLPQAADAATGTTDRASSTFDALVRDAPDSVSLPLPSANPATASRVAATPMLAPITVPADPQAGFDDGFGSRIVWMAEQRLGHADLRVTPEHLGTIEVRLQLDGAKVSAEFFSAQSDVRQALEASMGRLRDLLGQHGLQLAQADVGQQRSGQGERASPESGLASSADAEPAPQAPVAIASRRLLDEVA